MSYVDVLVSSTNIQHLKSTICTKFVGVTSVHGDWILTNVNLVLSQSNLSGGNFTLRMTGSNTTGYIKITNSTWGHLNVSRGFEISISDCYFSDIRISRAASIDTTFCNISVKNCIFSLKEKRSGRFPVLRAISSHIQMENVTFTMDSNEINEHAIQIRNESKLHMENSNNDYSESHGTHKGLFNIITVIKSHITLSGCTFISVDAVLFAYDDSEVRAVRSTFDRGSNLSLTMNNTTVSFYNCSFLHWKNLFQIINNSTVNITHSNITLNKPSGESLIRLQNESKMYLRDSNVIENSIQSTFLIAQSGCLLLIEECVYTNNTAHNDSNHFLFSDNTTVLVKNSDFFNNFGLRTLIHVTQSNIHLQGTKFHEKDRHMKSGFLTGKDSHVDMDSCSFHCDENGICENLGIWIFLVDVDDSVLNINNSIFHYHGAVHAEETIDERQMSVSVINSVFNQTLLCGECLHDVNIKGSRFENGGVVILNVLHTRIANSRLFGISDPLDFTCTFIHCNFMTLNTVLWWKNFSIGSNMKFFMKQAEKKGLIKAKVPSMIKHTETAYASCKYN